LRKYAIGFYGRDWRSLFDVGNRGNRRSGKSYQILLYAHCNELFTYMAKAKRCIALCLCHKKPARGNPAGGKLCRYVASNLSMLLFTIFRSDSTHNHAAIIKHISCDREHLTIFAIKKPARGNPAGGKLCRYVASNLSMLLFTIFRSDPTHSHIEIIKYISCDSDHLLRSWLWSI